MNKFSFIALWDAYRGLLTPTQREITDLYFNLDLTVSEIAEQLKISRQGVSECLKTCRKQLEEYEEKLGFCRALREICLDNSFRATDACRWAEKFRAGHPEFSDEIAELLDVIQKDYAEEVRKTLSDPEKAELTNNAALKYNLKVE